MWLGLDTEEAVLKTSWEKAGCGEGSEEMQRGHHTGILGGCLIAGKRGDKGKRGVL